MVEIRQNIEDLNSRHYQPVNQFYLFVRQKSVYPHRLWLVNDGTTVLNALLPTQVPSIAPSILSSLH